MSKIGIAGDWHGSFQWTRHALHTLGQAGVREVFHAGDFSLGWPGKWPDLINICESVCKRYGMVLYVTPGNHENWEWINTREFDAGGLHFMTEHTAVMARGARLELGYTAGEVSDVRTLVSLGGAPSIDFSYRTRGVDWFPEEVVTEADLTLLEEEGAADIMICHDAPSNSTDEVNRIHAIPVEGSMFPRSGVMYARRGTATMDRAVRIVNPDVYVHGHMHVADEKQVGSTHYVSLACNGMKRNLATLDLATYEVEWLDILQELPK